MAGGKLVSKLASELVELAERSQNIKPANLLSYLKKKGVSLLELEKSGIAETLKDTNPHTVRRAAKQLEELEAERASLISKAPSDFANPTDRRPLLEAVKSEIGTTEKTIANNVAINPKGQIPSEELPKLAKIRKDMVEQGGDKNIERAREKLDYWQRALDSADPKAVTSKRKYLEKKVAKAKATYEDLRADSAEDIFTAKVDEPKYETYALPDRNPETYKEVVYSSPKFDNLGKQSGHFSDPDYKFHVRVDDVIGSEGEVRGSADMVKSYDKYVRATFDEGNATALRVLRGDTEEVIRGLSDNEYDKILELTDGVRNLNPDMSDQDIYDNMVDAIVTEDITPPASFFNSIRSLIPDKYIDSATTNATGKKVRRIHEIQSDLLNEAFKQDYKPAKYKQASIYARKAAAEGDDKALVKHYRDIAIYSGDNPTTGPEFVNIRTHLRNAMNKDGKYLPDDELNEIIAKNKIPEKYLTHIANGIRPAMKHKVRTFKELTNEAFELDGMQSNKNIDKIAKAIEDEFYNLPDDKQIDILIKTGHLDDPDVVDMNELPYLVAEMATGAVQSGRLPKELDKAVTTNLSKSVDFTGVSAVPEKIPMPELEFNYITEGLKRQIVDAANSGQEEVWVAIRPEGVDTIARADAVQARYDTQVLDSTKKMAKRIGGTFKFKKGYAIIGIPAAGVSLPLYAAEDQEGKMPGEKIRQAMDQGIELGTIRDYLLNEQKMSPAEVDRAMIDANRDKFKTAREKGIDEDTLRNYAVEQGIVSSVEAFDAQQEIATVPDKQGVPLDDSDMKPAGELTVNDIEPNPEDQPIDQQAEPAEGKTAAALDANDIVQVKANQDPDAQISYSKTLPKFPEIAYEEPIFHPDVPPEELLSKLENINQWSTPLLTATSWFDEKTAIRLEKYDRELGQTIVGSLKKLGVENVKAEGDKIFLINEKGEQNELTSSFIDNMLDMKFEFGGVIIGAAKGSALGTPLGPAGMIGGGIIGAAIGAGLGKYIDVVANSYYLRQDVNQAKALAQIGNAGYTSVMYDMMGGIAFKGVKYTYDFTKWFAKAVTSNERGAWKALIDITGKSREELLRLADKMERYAGQVGEGLDKAYYGVDEALPVARAKSATSFKIPVKQKAASDFRRALEGYISTTPGGEKFIQDALDRAKTKGSPLKNILAKRAADLNRSVEELAKGNTVTNFVDHLNNYLDTATAKMEGVKQLGADLIRKLPTGEDYRFNLRELTVLPALREAKKKLTNFARIEELDAFISRLEKLGLDDAMKGLDPDAPRRVAKEAIGEIRQGDRVVKEVAMENKLAANVATKERKLAFKKEVIALQNKHKAMATEIKEAKDTMKNGVTAQKRSGAKRRLANLEAKLEQSKNKLTNIRNKETLAVSKEGVQTAKGAAKLGAAKQQSAASTRGALETMKAAEQEFANAAPAMIEEARPLRDFQNLLEARELVMEFKGAMSDVVSKQKGGNLVDSAIQAMDDEIAYVARNHMDEGEKWLGLYGKEVIEQDNVRTLQKNVLYKALTKPGIGYDEIIKALSDKITSLDGTFKEVLRILPNKNRVATEGAVLKHLVEQNTKGMAGGPQSIDFVALSNQLKHVPLVGPANRATKQLISDFAEIFKNDPQVMGVLHVGPGGAEGATMANSVQGKFSMSLTKEIYDGIVAMIPWTVKGQRKALVRHTAKVMDNPIDAKSIEALVRELPDMTNLKSMLHDKAAQYAAYGAKQAIKQPLWTVSPTGIPQSSQTTRGKGILTFANEAEARKVAKETGGKIREMKVSPSRIATEKDIARIIGRDVRPEDYSNPSIQNQLMAHDYLGWSVGAGDRVLYFK